MIHAKRKKGNDKFKKIFTLLFFIMVGVMGYLIYSVSELRINLYLTENMLIEQIEKNILLEIQCPIEEPKITKPITKKPLGKPNFI